MRFIACLIFYLLIGRQSLAQAPLSLPSLRSPVDHPIRLSGTFGELRSNHFHGGLDIKSEKGSWGDPVYAADDGYIARISVAPGGYGKALYLNHPASGLTTVYGHLQSFSKEVEAFVLQNQKDQQSFAIDLSPDQNIFVVQKGEQIAKMGSTGYSFGPHLHFEIRRTKTEKILNPMLYPLEISDIQKPIINGVVVYQLDHELQEYGRSIIPYKSMTRPDTLTFDAWRIGLGLETYDPHNAGRNKNGIYALTITLDRDTIYRFSMDSISFKDQEYFDVHIDYQAQVEANKKIHRCYKLPTDHLSIYHMQGADGIIPLFKDRLQLMTINVTDFSGNRESLSYYLRRAPEVHPPTLSPYQYKIVVGQTDTIRTPYLELIWPKQALYQSVYFQYASSPISTPGVFSAQYHLDQDRIPLHAPLKLRIRPFPFPDSLKEKLTIVRIHADKKPQNVLGLWKGDWLEGQIANLGTYQIVADTTSPTIKLERKSGTSEGFQFSFLITDDLPPPGGLQYRFSLNDQWILGEYDLKNDRLTCRINRKEWIEDKYHFKLLVEDSVGNTSTYDSRLNFK